MKGTMRQPAGVLAPAVVLALLLVAFLGHLADPGALLATRDIPIFHLPLRTALVAVAESGAPTWNPWIHGGQPILSNPNYAAFYPPTWIALLVPVHYSLSLVVLMHAAFAFAGAYRFARGLGCSAGPALMAGIGFAFGASLATTSLLNFFCALAWLPWVLFGCERSMSADGKRVLSRGMLVPGVAFGFQMLAGEPVVVLITGLAAAALALGGHGPNRSVRLGRLAAICVVAVSLAAVQLAPTLARLGDTPRAEGLDVDRVLAWSTSPQRLAETVWPRAWGDPMRVDEDLFFGWSLHDKQFPYLVSIYSGLLVVLLALGGLASGRIRHRAAWLAMIGGGIFLAIGAHNPVMLWLGRVVPFLSRIRYPEKFLVLMTCALVFAAALGWQRILDARPHERRALTALPLTAAALLTAANLALLALLSIRPEIGEWFADAHTPGRLGPEVLARSVSFFRQEVAVAALVAAVSLGVLVLHRCAEVSSRLVVALTLAVLAADLWYYNHSLTPVVEAAEVLEPPAALGADAGRSERIFTERSVVGAPPVIFRTERPGPATVWDQVDNAEPYVANVWGFGYAIHRDFDLMATRSARLGLSALEATEGDPEAAYRVLGAWSVRHLIANRPLQEVFEERLAGEDRGQIFVVENPAYRERYRFEPEVTLHEEMEDAVTADRDSGFGSARWIVPRGAREVEPSHSTAELLEIEELPASARLVYRADGVAPLTIARGHHAGWRARLDGAPIAIYPTSLGMMGLLVPPGEHTVELRFREAATLPALAVSLLALLAVTGYFVAASSRS